MRNLLLGGIIICAFFATTISANGQEWQNERIETGTDFSCYARRVFNNTEVIGFGYMGSNKRGYFTIQDPALAGGSSKITISFEKWHGQKEIIFQGGQIQAYESDLDIAGVRIFDKYMTANIANGIEMKIFSNDAVIAEIRIKDGIHEAYANIKECLGR